MASNLTNNYINISATVFKIINTHIEK